MTPSRLNECAKKGRCCSLAGGCTVPLSMYAFGCKHAMCMPHSTCIMSTCIYQFGDKSGTACNPQLCGIHVELISRSHST